MTEFEIKSELLQHCQNQVGVRFSKIKQTIEGIEES